MDSGGEDSRTGTSRRTPRPHYIPIVVGPDRDFGGITDELVAVVHDPGNPRAYDTFKELITLSLRRGDVVPTPPQVAHLVATYLSIYMHRVGRDPDRARTGLQVAKVHGRPIVLVDLRALPRRIPVPPLPAMA